MAKILVNVPDGLLEEVDRKAGEERMTRSEAMRVALRGWLRIRRYVPPIDRPGFAEIEARMNTAARTSGASVPAEALIRMERESH